MRIVVGSQVVLGVYSPDLWEQVLPVLIGTFVAIAGSAVIAGFVFRGQQSADRAADDLELARVTSLLRSHITENNRALEAAIPLWQGQYRPIPVYVIGADTVAWDAVGQRFLALSPNTAVHEQIALYYAQIAGLLRANDGHVQHLMQQIWHREAIHELQAQLRSSAEKRIAEGNALLKALA